MVVGATVVVGAAVVVVARDGVVPLGTVTSGPGFGPVGRPKAVPFVTSTSVIVLMIVVLATTTVTVAGANPGHFVPV